MRVVLGVAVCMSVRVRVRMVEGLGRRCLVLSRNGLDRWSVIFPPERGRVAAMCVVLCVPMLVMVLCVMVPVLVLVLSTILLIVVSNVYIHVLGRFVLRRLVAWHVYRLWHRWRVAVVKVVVVVMVVV